MTGDCPLFTPDPEAEQSASDYAARLDRDRVEAEFNSPLTQHTGRKRLKRSTGPASLWQDPEQEDLFNV